MSGIYLNIRKLLVVSSMVLLASCGGSSGGSGGGDDGFPTPALPADAAKFDAANADTIAGAAVGFVGTLDSVTELKTEKSPSISQVFKLVTDWAVRRGVNSPSEVARTDDISAGLCITGTATATYEATADSESGTVSFIDCDIGSGIVINGNLPYNASWNVTTLDYNFHVGGTLIFNISSDTITIVMNLIESGNDGTGAFSSSIDFSLSGIPDASFLVTTEQPWVGNAFSLQVTDGQLIVHGSDNTRLQITVTGPNAADVDLDDGSGIFVFHNTLFF